METEMPLSIQRYIKFIENALYWDSDCREPSYFEIINKMNSNEEVYEFIRRKNPKIEEKLEELCEKVEEIRDRDDVERDIFAELQERQLFRGRNEFKKHISRISKKMSENYEDIGRLMDEYGMIDVLVERNNRYFANQGYSFMRVDKRTAMKEFDSTKNYNPYYYILNMKMLFQINKIAKLIESIGLGKILSDDMIKSKIGNDDTRIKILSYLKSEYLRKIANAKDCMTEEEQQNFHVAEKEYYRLFREYFNNLDFEKDLAQVTRYRDRKKDVYKNKGRMIETIAGICISNIFDTVDEKDLKATGITIDNAGKLVLGMNVYSYPMPMTVHISKSNIETMCEVEGYRLESLGKSVTKVPGVRKYKPLIDNRGKIFPTNVLYRASGDQLEIIRRKAKENPNDRMLQFFNAQIAPRGRYDKDAGIYTIEELL